MITVYGKKDCPNCDITKRILEENDIRYEYIDIMEDDKSRDLLIDGGFRTVPQIYVNKYHYGDYSDIYDLVDGYVTHMEF